jgi:hypothetical protein
MLNRKESKILIMQRPCCQLALPELAHFPPLPTMRRLHNLRSTGSSRCRPGTGPKPAGTLGILDMPLQAWCLPPAKASPITVVISRARGVRTTYPTERNLRKAR